MNKVRMFFNCVGSGIKKKFFKVEKADISHACEQLKKMADEVSSIEELKHTDEYMFKYNSTTRWQTL